MVSYFKQRAQLFANRSFNYVSLMIFCSAVCVGISYIALAWYILTIDNRVNSVAIYMLIMFIFPIILGPFAGYILDRFSKIKVISYTFAARLLLLLSAIVFTKFDNLVSIYSFCVIWSIINSFYNPAIIVVIREVLDNDDQLMNANTTINGIFEIGMMLGMPIGGFMISAMNIKYILTFFGIRDAVIIVI